MTHEDSTDPEPPAPLPNRRVLPERIRLKPFPQVALQVMELAHRDDITALELAEVVALDQAITTKVLRLANSCLYGCAQEIGSIEQAAVRLGTSKLVDVVATGCAGAYFTPFGAASPDSIEFLWRRSLAGALVGRLLAEERGFSEPSLAYTLGLLENIGQLALVQLMPDEVDRIHARVERGASAIEAERAELGMDHSEIAVELLRRWQFPDELIEATALHHAESAPPLASIGHQTERIVASLLSEHSPDPDMAWTLALGGDQLEVSEASAFETIVLDRIAEAAQALGSRD